MDNYKSIDGILQSFITKSHQNLLNQLSGESQNAMEYLQVRGITLETIIEHKIGYWASDEIVPDEIKFFGNDLVQDENSDEKRDLSFNISGKLIVPVYDEFGIAVGLATRKPSMNHGETWWNMPSPFYKGRHLFLLDKAKKHIYKENKVYVVEGYMDALFLYQMGIKNVVSIMGTAMTSRKIGLMARYCDNICVCFDMDKNKAGQEASIKAICQIHKFNFCDTISTMVGMPIGVDPDEYVQKYGIQEFLNKEYIMSREEIKQMGLDLQRILEERKENARQQFCKT